MQELKDIFHTIDTMMISCEIDYKELRLAEIDTAFFEKYQNIRIINSFLFNYSKIQDKIGAKLLKKVLYEQKEIDDDSISMKDVLNLLEKLKIIKDTSIWDKLREIRNILSHEYPFCIEERIENINLAMDGYDLLKSIYLDLKHFSEK